MDNIKKNFDFILYEVEAQVLEAEAEELKLFLDDACEYLNKWQIPKIIQSITPIIDRLHRLAAASRDEANKRKNNIEQIQNPDIKEIIELLFIDRLTLEEIGDAFYFDRTTISKKIKKYFKDI